MKNSTKILNIAGYAWVVLSILYIVYRYVMILFVGEGPIVSKVLSFINIWNIFFALIILSPGIICILLSDHFEKKKKKDKMDSLGT